ncbi:MAG: hypothetical protein KKD17_02410 [Nanoarchaeota archaeon]|nr:hypothetical protein [Nanoarchaeota archaeon]
MNEEERKKTLAEIEVKRKELDTLKSKLNELHSQKEAWFEKKRKATQELSDVVRTIREAKGKRNTFTKQVKDSKQRRQELNTLLKDKFDEMKMLQKEKQEITRKFGIHVDPSRIQQEIEKLELSIETEALPFSVEQRVMKRIAEKKKLLDQAKEVSDVFEKIHLLSKEIDKTRKKADESHRKVQTKAEASQQFHEEIIESSKEVKELRAKEEEALKNFVEWKTKYNEQNDLVRAKIDEINELRGKIDGIDFAEKKKVKKEEEMKIVEQKRSVEEKIKKGLKLTNEDLLAFQAREESAEREGRKRRQRPARGWEERGEARKAAEHKRKEVPAAEPKAKQPAKEEAAPEAPEERK